MTVTYIRIAISGGGGLAGASLVHALLKHPHLDVHIFESASEFKEAGAAIGITPNAQTALDLIGPSAAQCLQDAGGVPQNKVRFMLAQGDHPNYQIDEDKPAFPGQRLTTILLASVPPERIHTFKKLERVERSGGEHGPLSVDKLLCDKPEQPAMYLWEHPPTPTYVSGPVCVLGDAAHATTTWQGSGAGMSIEDSLILSALLGQATTSTEALRALRVYDQVRRPRTQQVVESSKGTSMISSRRGEETGLELEKIRSICCRVGTSSSTSMWRSIFRRLSR
ncbi:hypothetical protein PG989_002112 [Apiospora arundinis]